MLKLRVDPLGKKAVIFTDMDGTLYADNFQMMPETIEDLEFATTESERNPIPADINLCTGNPVFERVKNIGKKLNARFLIGSTGASIFDTKENDFVFTNPISDNVVKKIIDFANQNNFEIIFWNTKEYFYSNIDDQDYLNEIFDYHFDTDEARKLPQKYQNQPIHGILKVEFCCESKHFKMIQDFLKNHEVFAIETSTNVEVVAPGVSKGEALKYVVSKFYPELTLDDIFSAGDSTNDIHMLEICGYSYAMDNSPQSVKEAAKYYTSSVEQNGLGEAVEDYLYRYNKVIKPDILNS